MSHTMLTSTVYNCKLSRVLAAALVFTGTLAAIAGWAQGECQCEDSKKTFRDGGGITVGFVEETRGSHDTYVVPINGELQFGPQCGDPDEYRCDCATWDNPCQELDPLNLKWSCGGGVFTATGNPDQGDWTSPDGESPAGGQWHWTAVRPGVYTITLRGNDLGQKPAGSGGECDDVDGIDPTAAGAPSKTVTVKAIGGPVWSTNNCTGEYPVTKPDGCGACQEKTVQYKAKWAQPPGTTFTWTVNQPTDPVVASTTVGNDLQVSPVRKSPDPQDMTLYLTYILEGECDWAMLPIHCQASQSVNVRLSSLKDTGVGTPVAMCKMKWIALIDQHGSAIHNMYCTEQLTACQGSWGTGSGPTRCHNQDGVCMYGGEPHGTSYAGDWPDHIGSTRASPAWTGTNDLVVSARQDWYGQGALLLHQALHECRETPAVNSLYPRTGPCP
ncbi:MAG: hypothetical protein COY42_00355 [Armatimonadetes bacterium CG_4_10_14_0_8_um_filter_66_14]|nr:MAG: hypothetical protein COY42_00355 [Armatimonadetes bacterium CG_4_10_14_0_8_um_filter_66_14]PJB68884.1 MAG: hypothetical protein CO096_14005 [Armatimonadetes bacterium CG_4_9_14_3_um_filter_66_14]